MIENYIYHNVTFQSFSSHLLIGHKEGSVLYFGRIMHISASVLSILYFA
jgi:hypothetical protein